MLTWLKTHKLVVGLILLAIIFGIYRFINTRQVSYEEYTVTRGNIQETLELSGEVDAEKYATLRFLTGGLTSYVGAQEGDSIAKWQTLASLDSRQLHKVLEQKLNLYAIERGEFDQGQDDYQKNIDDGDIDQELRRLLEKNQYQLDNTVKDVEYQDLALKLSRIYSPISGILVESPSVSAGSIVAATDKWVVVDPLSLQFVADLDETELVRVHSGQAVQITLDAFPDKIYSSSVGSISFSPKETTTGTVYTIKMPLSASDLADLRLGLNGTAAIILSRKDDAVLLPSAAVTTLDGKTVVYVKSGNKYLAKTVTTGIENNGQIEIVSGMAEGEHVYQEK